MANIFIGLTDYDWYDFLRKYREKNRIETSYPSVACTVKLRPGGTLFEWHNEKAYLG